MSKDDPIVYTFTGERGRDGKPSQWHYGIPARDLTQADVDRIERKGDLDTLKSSPIYKKATGVKKESAKADDRSASDAGKREG